VWPPGVAGLLVTEAVRGEGGILRNANGERFMERYDPNRLELSTRDVVARANYTEVKEGRGSPRGGVFLDVSHLDASLVKRKLPSMYAQFHELAGVDITREPMEVGPTCHYTMGGIAVDAYTGESDVPGLFAVGECSGGMHGANRLGGNSLSDLVVFGKLTGEGAAHAAAQAPPPAVDELQVADAAAEMLGYLGEGGEDPYALHGELQDTMQALVGIYRDEEGLTEALERLRALNRRAKDVRVGGGRAYNPGWHLCRELQTLIVCAGAVTRAALLREESRGAHSRLDFPQYDDFWGEHNVVVTKRDDWLHAEPRRVLSVVELEPLVDARKAQEAAA